MNKCEKKGSKIRILVMIPMDACGTHGETSAVEFSFLHSHKFSISRRDWYGWAKNDEEDWKTLFDFSSSSKMWKKKKCLSRKLRKSYHQRKLGKT